MARVLVRLVALRLPRPLLVVVALLASLLVAQSALAATYRNHIARVPAAPTSVDTVRVWMDSDTVLGETAGIEYHVGTDYIKVLGTYDTSYPGANWRADIPAQAAGTFVEYQLFTRNQGGSDYGFTGFNWNYTVAAPPVIPPTGARAIWLDEGTLAWNGTAGASFRLHYDPDGAINLATSPFLTLTPSGTVSGYAKYPNATGLVRLTISPADFGQIPTLLTGQLVVAAYNGGGAMVDSTRVQLQGVLDDLYGDNAASATLGLSYSGGSPTARLWAPTARSVTLRRYADATTASFTAHAMTFNATTGVWSVAGAAAWDRQYYVYDVEVYVPSTDAVTHNLVTDPYAVSLSLNSARSQFVDLLGDATLKPAGWDGLAKPPLDAPEDISVYELHVRDFSINDPTVAAADRGTYRAFFYDGPGPNGNAALSNGMAHLRALAAAGLSHLHLLPVFDIASVNEDAGARVEPNPDPSDPPNSPDQQAEVGLHRATDGFNWGYDPFHYGTPEGSYSSNPADTSRIIEFRQMVQTLNGNGLRVVMDVVYNHTNSAGQAPTSVLDRVVPGYYYRLDNDGNIRQTSCCPDTAAEFAMMQKLMVDTVRQWAVAYKVDSFRFDLMNFHTEANMVAVQDAIEALTVASDGVDGSDIFLYGEGWDFGSAKEKGLPFASQFEMAGTGIGTFNDRLRDAAHGGYSTDTTGIRQQGFVNGLSYDWNGYFYPNRFQGDLRYQTDRLRVGLAGNLQGYAFTDQNGTLTTGVAFNGSGYALDPQEAVQYVEKHDNETLWDQNAFKMPPGATMAERVRAQNMGLSVTGLSQGVPFFHAGMDMLRSKSLDRNSYDSGDWFNRLDFSYSDNNFGVGLPPAWDNSSRWGIMSPLLADSALAPATGDIVDGVEHFREILRIRDSSPLFRLRTASDINSRIHFFNTGPSQQDGLVVMTLADNVGTDLDPAYEWIVVLFNANKVQQTHTIGALAGLPFALHPVQADATDADPVVQTSSFNGATGAFTIPARTTAVFVSAVAPASTNSGLDYVGDMFPVGGSSTQRQVGDASGLSVYVQVYEPGVTPGAGQGLGIQCYLHWGEFGTPWSDTPMAYNAAFSANPSNDEYFATIPTASLPVGTYGFTAYCTNDRGATKKWQAAGDGILSITPAPEPDTTMPAPPGGVFVHLFEWRWADIQRECPYLASEGYTAVQVSPPQEHVVPFAPAYPWYVRYQAVSYSLGSSRSGTLAEFQSMIAACRTVGVDIYVDAIINHMTGVGSGTGTNGSPYTSYDYPDHDPADFHYCGTPGNDIQDYGNRGQVQNCELVNLADLDTSQTDVRDRIRAYLQGLLNLGVAGFRLDASKHMATYDIEAILAGLVPNPSVGAPYIFQEVIEASGEPVKGYEYFLNGDVTEFDFSQQIGAAFNNCGSNLAALQTMTSGAAFMHPNFAVTFTDNHDNQRGHGAGGSCIVDHRDGQVYNLANVFLLAYPYGYAQVMSSYHWDPDNNGEDDEAGPPSTTGSTLAGSGPVTLPVYDGTEPPGAAPARCDATHWVCEHRRTAISNMVAFRADTLGEPVTDWWTNGANGIAFGRDDKGYVAINREATSLTRTFDTSLPPGTYCDVTKGELTPLNNACTGPTVTVDAAGNIVNRTVASFDTFAIHEDQKIDDALDVTVASFEASAQGQTIVLAWDTVSELNNVGFNLWRGRAADVQDERINDTLIPSQAPGSGQGFVYEWVDSEVEAGVTYFYRLEAIDTGGASEWHGPVSATVEVPTAVQVGALAAGGVAAWPLAAAPLLFVAALGLIFAERRAA